MDLMFSPSLVKMARIDRALKSTAALRAESKSSPGMKRLTARRTKPHCGTCSDSHGFWAHHRRKVLTSGSLQEQRRGLASDHGCPVHTGGSTAAENGRRPRLGVVGDDRGRFEPWHLRLEAGPGVEQHDALVAPHETTLHKHGKGSQGGRRLEADETGPGARGERLHRHDLGLWNRDRRSAGAAEELEDEVVADGGRDAD